MSLAPRSVRETTRHDLTCRSCKASGLLFIQQDGRYGVISRCGCHTLGLGILPFAPHSLQLVQAAYSI